MHRMGRLLDSLAELQTDVEAAAPNHLPRRDMAAHRGGLARTSVKSAALTSTGAKSFAPLPAAQAGTLDGANTRHPK
jgi:hypothetical protein